MHCCLQAESDEQQKGQTFQDFCVNVLYNSVYIISLHSCTQPDSSGSQLNSVNILKALTCWRACPIQLLNDHTEHVHIHSAAL